MSEQGHVPEHPPDPAALDELTRAFDEAAGREPDVAAAPDTAAHDAGSTVEPIDGADRDPVDESDHEPVDERDHDPVDEQVDVASSTPPRIIRIDDISGAVGVRDADEPGPVEPAPPARHDPDRDERPTEVVVIGAEDDELPDAVYVEGSLDRSGKRTIVFIEDDATDDPVAADAGRNAQRGIEPRMRERRVAVKRAQGRKRLLWVGLGAGVVVVVVGALAVLGSPLFAVRADQVTLTGAVYTDADGLAAVVDDLVGTPVLRVDTERLEADLEEIPWVDEAHVTVDFPHAATIDIRERAAMTTYQGLDGRFRVLDREGRVLDVIDKYPFAYVLIDGPDPVDLEPGAFAPTGYAAASELAKNLTASIRGRVEYIDVTASGSRLVLYLDDGSTVFFGEARDLFAKLVRLETVLAADPEREPGQIDVSTDDVTS